VVLVYDHVVVREGIAELLAMEPDLEIVGCAGEVDEALKLVRRTSPDLILCDLNLPGMSGAQAVQVFAQEFPRITRLVLTAHDSLEYVRAAFAGCAIGFVCKDASRSELLRAVRRAASGRRTVCGNVWEAVVSDWLEYAVPAEPPRTNGLDAEACRVIRGPVCEMAVELNAQEVGRGVKAVEKYRAALMRRLGLTSTANVTRFAVESQLVSSQELDRMLEAGST
jgi:DNA-binding NarL/FixJ family response regulator